jgi:heme/copper-type cytochrome/quinol oxidase subunit 3
MLLVSSLALRGSRKILRWVAITTAIIFLLLQSMQWRLLLHHHTAVVWNSGTLQVVDGYPIGPSMLSNGHQMDMPDKFDIHTITLSDFPNHEYMGHGVYMEQKPNQDLNYGPSRNNFFACYFLMSAAHVLHLLAGLVAVLWFMLFAKGKLPVAVQIYWHFVNAVGVVAFLALYFV